MVSMNRLSTERQTQVVSLLVEGMSIRSIVRVTGVAKNTVAKLLVDLGWACNEYTDGIMDNLPCTNLQVDEIWSFCHAKAKNVPVEHRDQFGYGDVWTWTAIDADTKLVPCWLVGERSTDDATLFLRDLASRLANRVQLSSDGFRVYLRAVDAAFGGDVDFAMIHKIYGLADGNEQERRYSPAVCTGVDVKIVSGDPDPDKISTSYVERQNLTMRMGMRRFTRLTNGFSKKIANHYAAVSLHFAHYNLCRAHQSLRVDNGDGTFTQRTPAMAAGIADHIWTVRELCELLQASPSN